MKKGFISIVLLLLFISALWAGVLPQSKKTSQSVKNLSDKYRKWLEQEVVYIISEKERQVFLSLQTDRERDIFIEAFWKQRDPTPNTPENEFKTEHYRRIKYANDWFGKETASPGWRTEMGRIYIILGEPKQITKLESESELYPTQIWFYSGMEEYGLPPAFNVVFFKKYNAGDYVLYSPLKDGAQSLMWNYDGDPADYVTAYRTLANINPDLASISISLIPNEMTLGNTPSMASDLLIYSKIPSAPTYKVSDSYAEKLLAYKDIIDVDYTANYIENDFLADVFIDSKNTAYVHYLIEPRRLSFEQYGDKFTAVLEVNGTVVDNQNTLVYQFERRVPIEMNPSQIDSIKNKLFSFQDIFPLIPGKYKLNVIVKNTVSKEFTTFETGLNVPLPGTPWMSDIILANTVDRNPKQGVQIKPFSFKGALLRPSPRNDFLQTDIMTAYVQFQGLNQKLKDEASIEFTLIRGDKPVKTISKKLSDYTDPGNIIEDFELKDLVPDYYFLQVVLLDGASQPLLSKKENFFITPLGTLSRPWVLSLPYSSPDSPEIAYILGLQLFNKKEFDGALPLLESAYRRQPANQRFALELARLYLKMENYSRAKDIAEKFRNSSESSFLLILGQSWQALKGYEEAIAAFKTYLTKFGTNLNALNAIGDCYLALNQKEEALEAFEKSLQLDPKQEKIRSLVKSLKEKHE
ncbi:MAG: GWxTD domain-containing protein [Acidobacteriota bacterium]|nr:GWxTD domain-containing protein [Acidobacteriota bacterium]